MRTCRLAALALLLPLCGCIVLAAGAVGAAAYGAISYHENESRMDLRHDLPMVFTAAQEALIELGFPADASARPGPTEGTITAGEARVIVERHAGNFTRLRVVVGTFRTDDNKRRADLVLEAIRRRLGD